MSNKQHLQDVDQGLPHVEAAKPAGGACLNRHQGGAPDSKNRNSCFHRWQAYVQMASERSYYNGKIDNLVARESDWIRVAAPGMPRYARRWLPRPTKKDNWDHGKTCWRRVWNPAAGVAEDREVHNFYERSSVPYNHQAHHLIPNGELAEVISNLFSDLEGAVVAVRRGLLKAEYNLNHMKNMIMLPMDRLVSQVIGLPLHQSCWSARSHKAWSGYVKDKLEAIFGPLQTQLKQHKSRDYASVRTQLEETAVLLRNEVLATAHPTLDALANSLKPSAQGEQFT